MDPWYFKVRRCCFSNMFIAWCAHTPDLQNGPLEIDPDQDVHFEFGWTAKEALFKLKCEVLV
jgi:hypothetical protein